MSPFLSTLMSVFIMLNPSSSAEGAQIRLSGSAVCSGRVEVFYRGSWGTVCHDRWDMDDAQVVCRQMNCGTAKKALKSAHFGQGSGQIWLDEVECSGRESSLTECRHQGFGSHNCGHDEDAGVVCSVNLPKPSISMAPSGQVTWGQSISVTCSVSTQHSGGTFVLTKTSGSFRMTQGARPTSATFNMAKVTLDHEGSYRCQYLMKGLGADVSSPLSDPLTLSVTVVLPKPRLSMTPPGEVAWGTSVGVTCSISTKHVGGTFTLQKTSGSFRKTQSSSSTSATFNIHKVTLDDDGFYQCQYHTTVSTRAFNSPQSDSLRLSVTVVLPKPRLSMTPPGEVTWGTSVDVTCSISTQHVGGTFTLQKTSGSFRKTQSSSSTSATFNIHKVTLDDDGFYQCQYHTTVSTRAFNSPQSDSIRVTVNVPLQQPNISVTSPNGGLFWGPGGAEVTRGYSFVISCWIESLYPGGRFSLIFSGSNTTNMTPAVNNSASFNCPGAEFEHQGNYSCVYQVSLSQQTFSSTRTTALRITVKLDLLLVVLPVSGGLLLLLLVLVVVCLVHRRRRRVNQLQTLSQTQMAVDNQYEVFEEVYEAVDFEPVYTKNSPEQEGEEEEEENVQHHQEEESDKEEEGEDSHIWDYSANQEIYAAVEDVEDVEDEYEAVRQIVRDSSDGEDDYINVQQQLVEDEVDVYGEEEAEDGDLHVQKPMDNEALDIYGGDENIYQNY